MKSHLVHTISDAVTSFWAALSFLLLFAYPTPEIPTPSFEYHTAFNGVAFGIVSNLHSFKSIFFNFWYYQNIVWGCNRN